MKISAVLLFGWKCTLRGYGQIGILNNPDWIYESGVRSVYLGKQLLALKAASGKRYPSEARSVNVAGMDFELNQRPLSVTGPPRN